MKNTLHECVQMQIPTHTWWNPDLYVHFKNSNVNHWANRESHTILYTMYLNEIYDKYKILTVNRDVKWGAY